MVISPPELARECGISRVYAWQLLTGARAPSLSMAVRIFDATDLKLGPLKGLDEQAINRIRSNQKAAA